MDGLRTFALRGVRPRIRQIVSLALLLLVALVFIATGPRLDEVFGTLAGVDWRWATLAVGANAGSLLVRGFGWQVLLAGALGRREAGAHAAERAYLLGQLVNAVLPGRTGELTKIGVYSARLADPEKDWGVVAGAVAAHRLIDVVPLGVLILLLALSVGIPPAAETEVFTVFGVSIALLVVAVVLARRNDPITPRGTLGRGIAAIRAGLSPLHSPRTTGRALAFQSAGWTIEVAGVWVAFQAFGIELSIAPAGLVVVATNAITLFPFWPSNIGAFQIAVATMLQGAGIPWAVGIGFGLGLQGVETLATAALGLPAAAMEGTRLGSLARIRNGPPPDAGPRAGE